MPMSLLLLAAAAAIPSPGQPGYIASSPDLGKAEGRCRAGESGPSFQINVVGLRDRQGMLKAELYPATDEDFLADDNVLLMSGKTFRRVEIEVPQGGPVSLCIRTPGPGPYALMLLHDRDSNRKLGISVDGVGFPGDPKMCWGAPKGRHVVATAQNGPTNLTITMQYRTSLVCFGPLKK
jgi:uncharacterized protein (DUF2141 family)